MARVGGAPSSDPSAAARSFGSASLVVRATGVASRPGVFIAAIVLGVSILASAAPALVATTFSRNLAYDLESSALPFEQQLSSNAVGGPEVGPSVDPASSGFSPEVDGVWGAQNDSLVALRDGMPSPLREAVEPVQFSTIFPAEDIYSTTGETLRVPQRLVTAFDPRLADRVRIVEGDAPAPFDAGDGIDIVLSTVTAAAMEWPIGQTRFLSAGDDDSPSFRLSGTFEVADPLDPYWAHTPGVLEANYAYAGLEGKVLIGQGYANPVSWQSARAVMPSAAFSSFWLSLDPTIVNSANAAQISRQAREFTSVAHPLTAPAADPYNQAVATSLSFTSRLPEFLDLSLSRNAVTLQSFVMLATGPIGALVATLVLAARLFVRRLEATVVLLSARGATAWQLRGIAALTALAWALPASIVGAVAGTILAGGDYGPAIALVPVLVSFGAALIVAVAAVPRTTRATRTPGTTHSLGRLILELLIIALAAASVIVVLQRGSGSAVDSSSGPPPLDLLLAAEPLLLVLFTAVILMRLYPVLLGRVSASARRRAGLTGFLGSAGAARRPPGGPITAVAVLIGVSIAVFSGSLLTTLRTGIVDAAVTAVGADLRVDSPTFGDDEFEAIAGLDGVGDAASVYTATSVIARVGSSRESISVIVVDTDVLRRVQAGQPGAIDLPTGLAVTATGAVPVSVPVIVSDEAAALFGSDEVTIGGHELDVLASVPGDVALSSARTWVLVDSINAPTLTGLYSAPDRMFTNLENDADPDAVAAEVAALAGDDATVRTPVKLARVQQASPNIAALDVAVVLAILISGVCCALVIVMTLALGSAARARLFGILSAFGLSRRQAGALTAWEVAPVAAVSVIVGTLVGIGLPFLVIAGTDLTPFTAGAGQPAIVIDPALTATIALAFAGTAMVAVSGFALGVRSEGRRMTNE